MKFLPLRPGVFAIVDDDCPAWILSKKWLLTSAGYAARNIPTGAGKRTLELLHRVIMNCPPGKEVDHINGDPLDNRLANLRICSRGENGRNQKKQVGVSSKFKGVSWNRHNKKWRAQIQHCGSGIHLGRFKDETEAARAYDAKAAELFGEFAKLNFPTSLA